MALEGKDWDFLSPVYAQYLAQSPVQSCARTNVDQRILDLYSLTG